MAKLAIESGALRSELRLGSRQTLGRNPECAAALTDAQVSGIHCEISLDEANRFVIQDLKSRNGTHIRSTTG